MRATILLLALFCFGCTSQADRMAADDAKCKSFGAKPGTDTYVHCRETMETNRARIKAAILSSDDGPRTCVTTANSGYSVTTNCH
jgi:hypothetical protein